MHTIEIVHSIEQVAKNNWDAMAGDNVLAGYGWLKTAEETFIGNIDLKYLLVKDDDKLIAAAVCYVFNKTDLVENLDDLMFGRLKKYASILGLSFMPGFVCCPLSCLGKHFLFKTDTDANIKRTIMNALLDAIEAFASSHGLSPSFIHVMDDERDLMQLLDRRGYNKSVHIPLTYLDIEWDSFGEYRTSLKKVSRNTVKSIRREMNKNKNEGVSIEMLENPEAHHDCLYALLNNAYYKHNRKPFMYDRSFFGKLKETLGENALFYISRKGGAITGVCILLRTDEVGYIPMIGVNHEKAGNDFTYFNISFYRPITDAISNKLKRLYFGRGMYELKARRGCRTKNLYLYHKSFNSLKHLAVKPWFAILSAWNRHKLPRRVQKN